MSQLKGGDLWTEIKCNVSSLCDLDKVIFMAVAHNICLELWVPMAFTSTVMTSSTQVWLSYITPLYFTKRVWCLWLTEIGRIKRHFICLHRACFSSLYDTFLWNMLSDWKGNPMHGHVQKVAVLSFIMVRRGMANLFNPPLCTQHRMYSSCFTVICPLK